MKFHAILLVIALAFITSVAGASAAETYNFSAMSRKCDDQRRAPTICKDLVKKAQKASASPESKWVGAKPWLNLIKIGYPSVWEARNK